MAAALANLFYLLHISLFLSNPYEHLRLQSLPTIKGLIVPAFCLLILHCFCYSHLHSKPQNVLEYAMLSPNLAIYYSLLSNILFPPMLSDSFSTYVLTHIMYLASLSLTTPD